MVSPANEIAKVGYWDPTRGGELQPPPVWPPMTPTEPASNDEVIAFMRQAQGDGFWYIAGPYTKYPRGREGSFIDSAKATAWLGKKGVHVFGPIQHTYPWVQFGLAPDEYGFMLGQDQAIARSAVGICVLKMPTWETSYGVNEERKWFASWGKPEVMLKWPFQGGYA